MCVYEDDTWTALPARACSVGVSLRLNEKKFFEIYAAVAAGEKGGGGLKWKVPPFFRAAERWGESPRKEVASAATAAIHLYQ